MNYQVEHVAYAFYEAVHDGGIWEQEAETLKDEFRLYARHAISLLHQHHGRNLAEAFYSVATLAGPVDLADAA